MSGGDGGTGGPAANDGGGSSKGGGESGTGSGQGGQGFVAPTGPGSVSGNISAPTGFVPLVSGGGSFDATGSSSNPLAPAGVSGSQNTNPLANLTNPAGGTSSAASGGATGASTAGGAGGVQDPTSGLSNPNAFVGPQPSPLDNPNTFVGPNTTGASAPSQLNPAQLGAPQPAAAGTTPAAATSGGGDNGGLLDKLVKGAGDSVTKNPLGAALSAGGLGYQILQGQQQSGANQTIADQANSLNAQGKQLAAYLQSGDLPPGLKASLSQATEGAKAKVIQNFANQGLSTDPTKNSALQQQLAAIDQQAIISTAQIGQQLLTTGINESGMASDLYKKLSDIDATQTAAIGKAIASMASALNGGGGSTGVQLKIGG